MLGNQPPERGEPGARCADMRHFIRVIDFTRRLPVWVRYVLTTALVMLALFASRGMASETHAYPFVLFFPVIIVCGLLLDRGNGLYATALSALLTSYFFLHPTGNFGIREASDVVAMAIYLATGFGTAVLTESLHVAFVEVVRSKEQLEKVAAEREVLLRELSHRMRNDLATVASLLGMQARSLDNAAGKAALALASDRVHVLARVHERLTMQEGSAVLDTGAFITDLCDHLRQSLVGSRPVKLELVVESHSIGLQRAVSLGLIINELLTNALKYAFPDDRSGRVAVKFTRHQSRLFLIVRDDGVGQGDGSGQRTVRGTGMGRGIVRALTAGLGGTVQITDAKPGVLVEIEFPFDGARA